MRSLKVDDVNTLMTDLAARAKPVIVTFAASAAMIAAFKKKRGVDEEGVDDAHFWEFSLRPATKASQAKSHHFADMANVRVFDVPCWLLGLASAADTTGAVKVHLTQQGNEMLATRLGTMVPVRHAPVEKVFEYATTGTWPSDKAVLTRATYWEATAPGHLPDYTPIGPFATWRIGVRPQDAAKAIQWDTLTGIQLEFRVGYQGFSTSGH